MIATNKVIPYHQLIIISSWIMDVPASVGFDDPARGLR